MPSTRPDTVHFRTCNLCEAMCGLRIELRDGQITSIRGDDEDLFSRGHLCPKAVALKDLHEDGDRLRTPMRRRGTQWEPVSWEDALDDAARKLTSLQKRYGNSTLATYVGNPVVHNTGALIFYPLFARALKTRSRFSATSVDQLPHHLAAYLMFGHQLLLPIPDIDHTRHFMILGANPLASNGSLMTAPDIRERLKALQKRGGRVVVVDPRRTETAQVADEHHFIRPGTDALLLLSLLHVAFEAGPRLRHLEGFSDGLDTVKTLASSFPPERVAAHTGLPADTVRRLARDFMAADSAACYGRIGLSTQPFGSLCQWLINVFNIVTGNFDREGGVLFTRPAFDLVGNKGALGSGAGSFGRWHTRVRGYPEFAGELPVAAMAEEMLIRGEARIRGLVTVAGNPVLSTPNGRQLDQALAELEYMVSIDTYINETSRHAHLILPPVSQLERGHYDLAFHALAVRNTAKYSPPLFEPPKDAKHDWQILLELMHRIQIERTGSTFSGEAKYRALKRLGPEGIVNLGLRMGPYGARYNPFKKGLSLKALRAKPHGVDLGPLKPSLPGRLQTLNKRLDLAPKPMVEDVERLRQTFAEPAEATPVSASETQPATPAAPETRNGELLLIGRRHVRDNNSWMHNIPKLVSGKPRCTLMIHPEDAKARGLTDGQDARVTSRVGEITVPVSVTDEVMRGVVSLPHGYGHQRPGTRWVVAQRNAGVSVNDLTDDRAVDEVSGGAAFSGVPVRVAPNPGT